ncbi:hypothetical protein OM428_18025 [Enterococcus gallinarum]|nr:hypothetical protein [Enterococcus gallinarum]
MNKLFIGTRYDKSALKDVIDQIDVKKYFGNITPEDLLN